MLLSMAFHNQHPISIELVMTYYPIDILTYDISKCLVRCGISKGCLSNFVLHKQLPICYG